VPKAQVPKLWGISFVEVRVVCIRDIFILNEIYLQGKSFFAD
jgi:hypothetical protein